MKKSHTEAIELASQHCREATTAEEKEIATKDFWTAAVDAWNDEVAGEITTCMGVVISIPEFEVKN